MFLYNEEFIMITVAEIMSTQVITLKASDSISTARDIMKKEDIRHIPVVDERSFPVGIITQRDILRVQHSQLTDSSEVNENSISLDKIMTPNIAYVFPADSLRSAGLKLQKYKYGCLPVLENDQIVGIITDSDFVSVAINLIEQMEYSETC
jgi:CBS domain-containing membrane protein